MEMRDAGVVESVYKSTIHSKLILMEADDGTKIVVESSANCNMNPRIEQSCVTVSSELFDFYWSYFHDVFEEEDARVLVHEIAEEDLSNEKAEFDSIEGATLFG